jgi:hypothetical protein
MTCNIHVHQKDNLESHNFRVAILFLSLIKLCFIIVSDQRFSTYKTSKGELIEILIIIIIIIIIIIYFLVIKFNLLGLSVLFYNCCGLL